MRQQRGSVSLDKRSNVWNFYWLENGKRRSKQIGTLAEFPTRASAWRAAKSLSNAVEERQKIRSTTLRSLVEQYRAEKMPTRQSTQRGYEAWLKNHVLPQWGDLMITDSATSSRTVVAFPVVVSEE